MECEFDYLVQCDCEGMLNWMRTPCLGYQYSGFPVIFKPGTLVSPEPIVHPTLIRRANLMFACPNRRAARFYCFDIPHKNTTHYFAHTSYAKFTKEADEILPSWKNIPGTDHCFYLGKFPIYFSPVDKQLHYAHNMGPFPRWPLTEKPFLLDVDIEWLRSVSETTRNFYLNSEQKEQWNIQESFVKNRLKWHIDCINRTYPPEPKPPRPFYRSDSKKIEILEKPFSELSLPTPERTPITPEQLQPGYFKLPSLILSFKANEIYHKVEFTLYLEY